MSVIREEYEVRLILYSRFLYRIKHHAEPSVGLAESVIDLLTENTSRVTLIVHVGRMSQKKVRLIFFNYFDGAICLKLLYLGMPIFVSETSYSLFYNRDNVIARAEISVSIDRIVKALKINT